MKRISAILLIGSTVLEVHASASDGIPLSPSDMTSALERKIVSGVGVMYPGSDLESATTPALALLDAEWPDPFLDRIGETISVRVSSTTGYYEFTDESGSVFWIEIPVAPLTWNWVAPFLRPYDPPTQDFSLIAPWHLGDRWRLSTETLEELHAVPPLLRSLPLRSAPRTNDVTNLCFTAFTFTETNLYFTAAWPTNDALPDNLLDLYCSTNELDRFRFLLSSHPATNPPVSFNIPSALVPNWGCATSHVHDATCPVVTNIVLSPLDGTTIYTNVVYGCAVTNSPQEAAFFRLGSRVDTDGDGLADAYELYVTGTSTNAVDTDLDGLSDSTELGLGTNPNNLDSDADGLLDGEEVLALATNPLAGDTDEDGLSDREEVGAISPAQYHWLDSGGATNLLEAGGDDNGIWTFALSSPFVADGVSHSRIAVDTNGLVFLLEPGGSVTNVHSVPCPLSTWTNSPAHIAVAALWTGMETDGASALRFFETTGLSVVEFDGFLLPPSQRSGGGLRTEPSRRASFQVVLPRTVHDTLDVYYQEIPEGGISVGAIVGVHNRDRGWFLLPDDRCTLPRPDDPDVNIESGRGFRYHLGFGTNPNDSDTDGDGLEDGDEKDVGTNPLDTDSDDDDVTDAEEVAAGTDPNDSADKVGYQSGAVLGNGAQGVPVTFQQSFPISKSTSALVGVWVASEEFPEYTGNQSQYNDTLYWCLSTNGVYFRAGVTNVNDLHSRFLASSNARHHVPGMLIDSAPVDIEWFFLSAPTNQDLDVTLDFEVVNVADGRLPSTMMASIYPLRVVQENWPDSQTATDFGPQTHKSKRIFRDGVAYVTGEPAAPTLTAIFQGLPDFVEIGWAFDLKTERPERGTHDNRRVPATGWIAKPGDRAWDIAAALDEIVGGAATLAVIKDGRLLGHTKFLIRGKNPEDADVESFISSHFPQDFSSYAKFIVRQESWDTRSASRFFIYNQFNNLNVGVAYREKVNMGTDYDQNHNPVSYGWGMAQITDSNWVDRTDVAWNWKTNLLAMKEIMAEKKSDHNRFIGYYRDSYEAMPTWSEPPLSYTLSKLTLSAEAWGVTTLYNGGGGLPPSSVPTHPAVFYSPWVFDPAWIFDPANDDGPWTLEQNRNNYTENVDDKSNKPTKE